MLLIIFGENSGNIFGPPGSGVEATVNAFVQWVMLIAEILAALLISIGVVLTLTRLVSVHVRSRADEYEGVRLTLSRFLALALEFQLAADVLATAVAPSWTQIGKLGAIAVIRTALNYFLAKEIRQEQETSATVPLEVGTIPAQ